MDRVEITESQILEALRSAMDRGENAKTGYTTTELAELTGRSKPKVRDGLRELIEQGLVEATQVERKRLGGAWSPRLGFRWVGGTQPEPSSYDAETSLGGVG